MHFVGAIRVRGSRRTCTRTRRKRNNLLPPHRLCLPNVSIAEADVLSAGGGQLAPITYLINVNRTTYPTRGFCCTCTGSGIIVSILTQCEIRIISSPFFLFINSQSPSGMVRCWKLRGSHALTWARTCA